MTPLQSLLNKCQKIFNEFIRLRDLNGTDYFKCISCGDIKDKSQLNAGHYYNVGHFDGLRFDEDNCHGQCIQCNKFLHGNLIEYSKNLPLKIGSERFNLLEIKAGVYKRSGNKWSRFDIEYRIKELKEKVNNLKT
jgi:hypothetical protein